MRIAGFLGATGAALAGGYYFSGTNDFAVTVHRPLPEVNAAISGLRTFNGGLRQAGLATVHVDTARPSDRELIYSAGDAKSDKTMRIAFTFEPGATAGETIVHAAIDVPAVQMPSPEGKSGAYYLSERKVERSIEESVTGIAGDLDARRSPTTSAAQLNQMLDLVAMASQPGEMQKSLKRAEAMDAAARREAESAQPADWQPDSGNHDPSWLSD
jgi:hypothetical protein